MGTFSAAGDNRNCSLTTDNRVLTSVNCELALSAIIYVSPGFARQRKAKGRFRCLKCTVQLRRPTSPPRMRASLAPPATSALPSSALARWAAPWRVFSCESKPRGLELTHIFNRGVSRKRADWVPASVVWSEDADAVLASDVDVIVELAGGLDPAGSWVRRALESGKSVVTANKKLIAYHGIDLERLAAAKGGHLKYGAAVAGGIPVIPGLEQGMAGDRIERMEGILNGTCNFILSKMEEGADYAEVLEEAQAKGYAEADPTEDVGGFDARAKLAILMRLALRVQVDPEEIVPRSITTITPVDFSYARDLGCTIRQVSRAQQVEGQIAATVGPMLVALRSPLAWSQGTENMVIASGHYGGDVVFSGHGAGGHPTAVAVVSDLLALAHGSQRVEIPSAPARLGHEFEVPHYIRFLVKDRPGIVAAITTALANEQINIRAIVQKAGYPADALPFVVTVEPCKTSALQRALASIRAMDCMLVEPLDLQMLE